MRLHSALFALLGLVDFSEAWSQCFLPLSATKYSKQNKRRSHFSKRGGGGGGGGNPLFAIKSQDLHEFDYLLHEHPPSDSSHEVAPVTPSRRIIRLGNSEDQTAVMLTSSAAAARGETVSGADANQQQQSATSTAGEEYDPYDDLDVQEQQYNQLQSVDPNQAKPTFESRLKQMDLQDIVVTLVIPAIISFASLRWGFNKVADRLSEKSDTSLESFAKEMIYHDGDFEEMRMCHADYSKKLIWMGPKKSEAMLKRYLAAYAKKKTVSPQAISTLSYVFTLFKLSEERAAQIMVALCKEMGTDKISSAGKILFLGSRILKSPEGKQALMPIKDMIKSTYRDEKVAETLVETSQQAIGEAAYRSTVLAGGKNQKTLTIGWEVLGLDKETATRIFEEEKKEGFVSERETMYGGQTTKYDSKGRVLDEEGKPEGAVEDDEVEEENPSNVYECQECGYTLFVAKGREFKFYGDDFKCPECGAKKDKFKPGNIGED